MNNINLKIENKSMSDIKNINTNHHGTITSDLKEKNLVNNVFLNSLKETVNNDSFLKNENPKIKEEIIEAIKNLELSNNETSKEINHQSSDNKFLFSSQEIIWLKSNDRKDWGKYLLNRYSFKVLPQKRIVNDFPPYVLIEPTSVCNLRCVMCFQIDKSFSSNKKFLGFIDTNFFKDLIKQCEDNNCNSITLASRGEPTLHKKFDEISEIIKESKILDTKINTNATILDEKKIELILNAGFNEVIFSVDAGTKKTYEEIRVKGKFEKVVKNIKLFNEIREKNFKNSKTLTRVAGVKINENQDIKQMTDFWSKIVDEVSIKSAALRWDTYNNAINEIKEPCLNLWNRMYIWYDGKVNPCDTDYKSYLCIGNAKEKTIKQLWNSEKYINLRNLHISNKRGKVEPCDRCTYTN